MPCHAKAIPVLLGCRFTYDLQNGVIVLSPHRFNLVDIGSEELLSAIDLVEPPRCKAFMEFGFQTRRVVRKHHGVHIELKRYRRIAQLIDPLHQIESTRHANLVTRSPKAPRFEMT